MIYSTLPFHPCAQFKCAGGSADVINTVNSKGMVGMECGISFIVPPSPSPIARRYVLGGNYLVREKSRIMDLGD